MYSRSGYEAILPFLIYLLGVFLIWLGFKKPIYLTFGTVLLSLSIYSSYTNKFLVPLLFISLFLFFRKTLLDKKNWQYLIGGCLAALLIQLPNLSLIFTKSFFVKSELSYTNIILTQYEQIKNIIPGIVAIPYLFIREFFSQYLTYFSLRSLFLDPDPFLGRSIPNLSVFYPWMFIPYLLGLFIVFKNRSLINYKFLLVLTIVAPIPTSFTKDPFWTYRAIPLLAPLIIIITIGFYRLFTIINKRIFILCSFLAIIYSLLLLWRGYFVFLPNERANDWQYGYQILTNEISKNNGAHFVIDNSRSPSMYLQFAFFMKLPPEKLQSSISDTIKNDYYNNIKINPDRTFGDLEIRAVDWRTDVYKNQILVGDNLTFSENQIAEHQLTQIFEIRDPLNNIVFKGFKTNPGKKCDHGRKLNLPLNPRCQF